MERSFDLYRRRSDRIAAGVAGGVADSLRVHDTFVRAAFVSLSTIWGLGFFLYIVLWLMSFRRRRRP
jgi:phage shock protein PspC (stress-responsive transcriptional regulator)